MFYSLNQMGCPVRVAGRGALELQGMAYYLPLGDSQRIDTDQAGSNPIQGLNIEESVTATIIMICGAELCSRVDKILAMAMNKRGARQW